MTEVQQARFDRLFNAYDSDRDGFLTLENFLDHAHKLAAMRGTTGSPAERSLLADLEEWWKQLAAEADSDGDGRVSREEFYDWASGLAQTLALAEATGAEWPLHSWIEKVYAMIDADGDGRITLAEYEQWCAALGIAGEMDVEGAFLGFDRNLDGYLSREEFEKVSKQFWLSPNPNTPGARWLGP